MSEPNLVCLSQKAWNKTLYATKTHISLIEEYSHMKHLLKDKGIQHSTKEIANVFSNRIVMNCIFSQIVECEESFVGFLFGFEIIL